MARQARTSPEGAHSAGAYSQFVALSPREACPKLHAAPWQPVAWPMTCHVVRLFFQPSLFPGSSALHYNVFRLFKTVLRSIC